MSEHPTTHDHGAHDEHESHALPSGVLIKNLVILSVLMVLTIVAAQLPYYGPFGWMNDLPLLTNSIALGIALTKMYFVVSIFMAVKFSTKLIKLFAIGGFAWLILLGIMFVDYLSRPWEIVPGWEPGGDTALPRSNLERESGGLTDFDEIPDSN